MNRALGYLKPYSFKVVVGLLIKAIAALTELFLPWLLAYVIDKVIPTGNISIVVWFGFIMLVSATLAYIGNVVSNRIASRISSYAIENLRNDAYTKILNFTNQKTDEFQIPSLISRMTSDTYHVYRMFNVMQRLGIRAPIILLGSIAMMISLDLYLAMVLIGLLPIITFVIVFISKKGIPFYTLLQQQLDQMVRVVRENIGGIRVIKALAKEKEEKLKFVGINEEVSRRERIAGYVVALLNPLMNLLLNIGLVLIVYIGAIRVSQNASTTGSIMAFLSYFTLILNSFLAMNRIFVLISRSNASSLRIFEILDTQEEIEFQEKVFHETSNHIEFRDVSFSYTNGKNHVENISFTIARNKVFGIIGSTGSGKSTIVQLLLRFYDAQQGQILIDGYDIKSYSLADLRQKFGVVLQNDVLFSSTVAENIRFGRDVDQDSMIEASTMAQAKEFIEQLSDRYHQNVQRGGANFSGGQRQRMLIARALATHPEIVVFDDASSALDYKTDALLRNSLRKQNQSTVLLIAQRVSTVLNADQILVLEEGRCVGLGTHDELLQTCDSYRDLFELQLGGGRNVTA